jgi:hypothetical protein
MRHYYVIFFLLFSVSLCSVEPMPEKMNSLYSEGLVAMGKKEFAHSKKAFTELLKEPNLPTTTSEEAHIQIIRADIALQNYGAARTHIEQLLQQKLLPFMFFRTKMELASLELAEHHLEAARRILKEQEEVCPLKDWPLENRLLYVTIQLLKE